MNKSDDRYSLRWAKKIRAINLIGGKCELCDEKNILKLCFHHKNPNDKRFSVSDINEHRWSIIKEELLKCQLLCQNCHRELHDNRHNNKSKQNKKILLELKNEFKCESCGYGKNNNALHFHHISDKKFELGNINKIYNSINDVCEIVSDELNKCSILCSNCHQLEHIDIKRFERLKNDINSKVISYKELRKPLDKNKILKMYNDGVLQKDIVKYFNCAKSTICTIIKNGKVC